MSDETTAPAVIEPTTLPTGTPVETPPPQPPSVGDGQTSPEAAKPPVGPPETYDLKAPEGFEDRFDPAKFAEQAKILKLSQEDAQAYVNSWAESAKAEDVAREAAWTQTQETWISEVKADPKVGGQNFERTQSRINAVTAKYGGPEVKEFFDSTGAGNHPALCRMLEAIGADLEQSKFVPGTPLQTPEDRAARMFPNSK